MQGGREALVILAKNCKQNQNHQLNICSSWYCAAPNVVFPGRYRISKIWKIVYIWFWITWMCSQTIVWSFWCDIAKKMEKALATPAERWTVPAAPLLNLLCFCNKARVDQSMDGVMDRWIDPSIYNRITIDHSVDRSINWWINSSIITSIW